MQNVPVGALERALGCAKYLCSYGFHVFENSFGPPYAGQLRYEHIVRFALRLCCYIAGPARLKKWVPQGWHTLQNQCKDPRYLAWSQWTRLQIANWTTWPTTVSVAQYPPPPPQVDIGTCRITYMGHSGVLVQMDESNLLIDTYFGRRLGIRFVLGSCDLLTFGLRRTYPPAFDFFTVAGGEQQQHQVPIHAFLVSHDHRDTFDKSAITSMLHWNGPALIGGRGLSKHVWRTDGPSLYCLDWYDSVNFDLLKIQFLPAVHSSGRGYVLDRNSVLWGSFLICSKTTTIFHAGGTGMGEHFSVIADIIQNKLRRTLDLAILPIGQYEVGGIAATVMSPDEAVQAHLQLGAKKSLAVHHDTFALGIEAFGQAKRGLITALHRHGVSPETFFVLEPGEHVYVAGRPGPNDHRAGRPEHLGEWVNAVMSTDDSSTL